MAIQQALNLSTPDYVHVPLVTNEQGQKLSKQTRAQPVSTRDAAHVLTRALQLLGQSVPVLDEPKKMLQEAAASWDVSKIGGSQVS
jgi:glutamyl-Q tRNA(Asp) synthetase